MKISKKQTNVTESKTDTVSVLLAHGRKKAGKNTLLGVMVDAAFLRAVDAAAEICGCTRSNFVRTAIAQAVKNAGVEIDDSSATSYRGQQTASKPDVLARAAGARAVRDSNTAGTPENVRKMELLAEGFGEEAINAYLYAKARAEKSVGRPLTPAEDEEFVTSAAKAVEKSNDCWGAGPPNANP